MKPDPADLTIAEAGAALRSGELTSSTLLAAVRRRAAATEARLHAYLTIDAEGAERASAETDAAFAAGRGLGPPAGIPLAVQDNLPPPWGAPTPGSPPRAARPPPPRGGGGGREGPKGSSGGGFRMGEAGSAFGPGLLCLRDSLLREEGLQRGGGRLPGR